LVRDSTGDEIKKAYYRAARKYHPDMHLQLPEDTKKKLMEIFTYVRDAYQTLTDPATRKEYNSNLALHDARDSEASGEQLVTPAVQKDHEQKEHDISQPDGKKFEENSKIARRRFGDGKVAFWDKNFPEAAQQFASAIYYDSSVSEYHYFYGSALGMFGKLKEAVLALNRADELKPQNSDILAELGHVYLKLGFPTRAKGYFGKALKLDPSNDRAKEGIKIIKN
jgi:tetratricopeptide (TPR) repeat protein